MKTRIPRTILAALLLLSTLNLQLSTLFAQGTAFTYQGQLKDGPGPANGQYDLTFSVFSVTSGGTTTPAAKLDVRGDIRLGPSGEFRATSSEENLRIIRGIIAENGNILRGLGFTVARTSADPGRFTITFTTPFASPPTVCATADHILSGPHLAIANDVTASNAAILLLDMSGLSYSDAPFHFIAIGPR